MELWQRCFRVKKGTTINNLPDECLQEIFSRASFPLGLPGIRDSLQNHHVVRHSLENHHAVRHPLDCAVVCKRWQAAVDPAVKSLHFDISAPAAEALIQRTPRFINLTSVTIALNPGLGPATFTDLLVALAANTPQLEELRLPPSYQRGMVSALTNCLSAWTRLRNLTLVLPGESDEESLALLDSLELITSMRELEVILLDDSEIRHRTLCQWLMRFTGIPIVRMTSVEAPFSWMAALTNLKQLDVVAPEGVDPVLRRLDAHRNLTHLKLDVAYLSEGLPDSISNLTALRRLVLDRCRMLTALPDSLGNLQTLNHLEINCVELAELPASIGELHQLNHLEVRGKSFQGLPDSVSRLTKLTILVLGRSSKLRLLPSNIGALGSLQVLDIRLCPLEEFPTSLCQLACLSRLTASQCSDLRRLPLHIGRLQALMELHLPGNRELELLPDGIADLRSLTTLDISKCPKLWCLSKRVTHLTRLEILRIHQSTREVQKCFLPDDPGAAFQGLRELTVDAEPVEWPWLPLGLTRLTGLERLEVWGTDLEQQPQGVQGGGGTLGFLGGLFKSGGNSRHSILRALQRLQHLTLETSSCERLPQELLKMPALMRLTWYTTTVGNDLPSNREVIKALRGKGCALDIRVVRY